MLSMERRSRLYVCCRSSECFSPGHRRCALHSAHRSPRACCSPSKSTVYTVTEPVYFKAVRITALRPQRQRVFTTRRTGDRGRRPCGGRTRTAHRGPRRPVLRAEYFSAEGCQSVWCVVCELLRLSVLFRVSSLRAATKPRPVSVTYYAQSILSNRRQKSYTIL